MRKIYLTGLQSIRESRLMTQRELAELTGMSQGAISRIEAAQHSARFSTIRRLAEALQLSPDDLIAQTARVDPTLAPPA